MLSPEEDFETWVFLFNETCAPKGDYLLLLPDFTRLFQFYAENSSLPEPISDFTYEFSNSIAISLLNSLFNLTFISEEELVSVKDSIKLIINSLTVGYKNNVPFCDKLLLKCLQSDQSFYQKNYNSYTNLKTPYSYLFSEIFQYFINEGPLQNIIDVISLQPTIQNIYLLSSILVNKLFHFQAGESSQLLAKIQDHLIKFFSQYNNTNLRDADKISLTEITKFVGQYITPDEIFSPLLESFLNFGNLCLRSSYVDKNLIGSEIFTKISSISPESFQKFSKNTQLLDLLFSNDLHETVLSQLSSIASTLFKNDPPTIEQLQQIYTRAELSPPSQKLALNKLLAKILAVCDESTIKLLVNKLTDEKKITMDLISFLCEFINEAAGKNPDGVSYATRYVLSLLDNDANDSQLVKEAIAKLCKCTLTISFRQIIYEYLLAKIISGSIPDEQYHSIKKLINAIIITGGDDVKKLIEICLEHNQAKLVKTIVMHSYAKLPSSALGKLTSSEEGWAILSKIIKKRGFSVFESTSNELTEIIQNLNIEEASMTQFLVVKEFLLMQGVKTQNLTTYSQSTSSIGSNYRVNDPRIEGTDIILKFITVSKDGKVNENALIFLLELYKDASPKFFNLFASNIYSELHSDQLLNISEKINNDENCDILSIFPIKQQLILSKLLKMVTAMINIAEKDTNTEDGSLKRHKSLHKSDITFTVRFGDEQKDVTVNPSITGNDLYGIISSKFNRKKEYYKILTENNVAIKYSDPLSMSGVRDGSLLVVTNPDRIEKVTTEEEKIQMREIISKSGTTEIYFNLLKSENLENQLKQEIWKFLMIMPSASNITIDSLSKAKSQMVIRYIIQYFNNNDSSDDELYTKVIDMICHGQIHYFSLNDALQLVRFHMNFKTEENATLFIEFLLNSLINEELVKIRQLIIDVLITYSCRYQPFLTSQLLSNEKRFSDIVLKTPNPHFPRLSAIFSHLTNYPKTFSMLLSLIDQVINRADIINEYFTLLMSVFNDSCDFDAAINACLRLLEQTNNQSSLKFVCCSFLSNIFSKKPSLIHDYSSKLFKPLLKTVFVISNTTQQETIINLLLLFCKDDENCKSEFFNALYNHFDSVKNDRWGYDPAMHTKSLTGFNGLRNLGATCYMNSVFQQLFFNNEFTRNVLRSRYQEDCLIELRAMFVRMMKSVRGVVDTSAFVQNWKPNNIPVNPREQQDACEFLLLLLDKLHDDLYKGEQVAINEGENNEYKSESIEPFWTLTLEVKGRSSFEDSFSSYLQKISVSGYFAESLNRKINILRYFRIKKVPKFLIVQLNRFEYDIVTWKKVKINDKFEFPLEFDLMPLTDHSSSNEDKIIYSLVGIINHCGTMEGGHYQSYIKRGEKWFNFNDSSVSEANEKALLEEAYGSEKKSSSNNYYYEEDVFSRSSAYLLFYVKKEALEALMEESIESLENEIDKDDYDTSLLQQIESENNEFVHIQSAFGTAMMNTVLNLDDLKLATTYFMNIFTHSRDSAMTAKFSTHFIKLLSNENGYDQILAVFSEKSKEIFEAFVHSDSSVSKSIQEIVNSLINNCSNIEKCRQFINDMIQYISTVITNWRCIHRFFEILMIYCNRDFDYIKEKSMPKMILNTIQTTLENTKSTVYLKNVDFSSFFNFVSEHINDEILENDDLNDLCSLSNLVLQSSSNADSFMKIILSCNELGLVDINLFIDKLLSSSKEVSPSLILSLTNKFTSVREYIDMFSCPRFSKENLVKSISKLLVAEIVESQSSIRPKLIDNGLLLFYLITCDDYDAIKEMESLYLELFPDVAALNNYPRAEDMNQHMEKFTFKDKTESFAIDKDYEELIKLLLSYIQGLNEMNNMPEKFFFGPKIKKKFNQMIRVFIWMILRTQYPFSDDQMDVIFKFFNVLHQQSINENSMMIEMIRLLNVIPRRDSIINNFKNLVTVIFGCDYNNILYEASFCVFIESMESDLLQHPELFKILFEDENFLKAFSVTCQSNKLSLFKIFIRIVSQLKLDISILIKRNLSLLLKNHVDLLIVALPYAKEIDQDNLIDNSSFEELISSIYALFAARTTNNDLLCQQNYNNIKDSFEYLHNEFIKRKGQIFIIKKGDTNEEEEETETISTIRLCIQYVCSMMTNPAFELYSNIIAQFVIDISMSNIIFENDVIQTVIKKDKNNIMNMLVLSRIGDQNMRNDVGVELSTRINKELTPFLIELACYLIDKDGIQDWTREFIKYICSSDRNVVLSMPELFGKVSTLLNESELENIVGLLNECGNKEKRRIIIEKIVEKRPDVKEQMLAALNVQEENL